MKLRFRHILCYSIIAMLLTCGFSVQLSAQTITPPDDFIGHGVGEDNKLARWETIVSYFNHIGERSDRVNVRDIGKTTEGRPFVIAEISSEDAIADMSGHMEVQRKIADPRLISSADEEARLIESAKVVVFVNCNLHSSEIASSQMALELLYDLATSNSPEITEILDKAIIILAPSANPDGLEKVIDWYERSLGTPWEGSGMPWLYQTYAGHDNNRDWFMLNLEETKLETKVLYKEWFPHIVYDIHQMGNGRARFFVPPFFDPKNPNIHPLTDDMLLIIGGHMAAELTRNGKKGILHAAMYDNWWQGGFRTTVYRHNMVGLLTEAASVNIASPIFQRKSELKGGARGMPDYSLRTNFPDPWPGGWWRLRDIVEYEKMASMSLFTLAARYHDLFTSNYIKVGREALERGSSEPPFAWLVPPGQLDPKASLIMLEKFHATGVEVHQAEDAFEADGVKYPKGTHILYCAQPYRAHLKDMMERQVYPDRTIYPGGPPESPYDTAGWTLPLQMGIRTIQVDSPFDCSALKLDSIIMPPITIDGGGSVFVSHGGSNEEYRLLNRLFREGLTVSMASKNAAVKDGDGEILPAGSLIISGGKAKKILSSVADEYSLTLSGRGGLSSAEKKAVETLKQPRIALYQPWGGVADEGWTRFVLDSHDYDYTSLHNAEIRAGKLITRYDCIVLPSIGANSIINGRAADTTEPQYVGGIGSEGIVKLQNFVRDGGTLVCIDGSSSLAIEHFNIPVKNTLAGKSKSDFFCPGSILRVSVDNTQPLAWGMPSWVSGYFARSRAFDIVEPDEDGDDRAPESRYPVTVVARYSDTVLLESGWIQGGDLIADKPAIVEVGYGEGQIVLFGFRVQHRGHPHGTFRFLFNAMQRSVIEN